MSTYASIVARTGSTFLFNRAVYLLALSIPINKSIFSLTLSGQGEDRLSEDAGFSLVSDSHAGAQMLEI